MTGTTDVRVRQAMPTEQIDVLNVLDGANLATDFDRNGAALARGDVFVAVAPTEPAAPGTERGDGAGGHVLGALVLDGEEIAAVAVRRRRRDQAVGTALVETASQHRDRLVATFDPAVRPFWESLGFEIAPVAESGRYRGVR